MTPSPPTTAPHRSRSPRGAAQGVPAVTAGQPSTQSRHPHGRRHPDPLSPQSRARLLRPQDRRRPHRQSRHPGAQAADQRCHLHPPPRRRRTGSGTDSDGPGRATGERLCRLRGRLTPRTPTLQRSHSRTRHHPTTDRHTARPPRPKAPTPASEELLDKQRGLVRAHACFTPLSSVWVVEITEEGLAGFFKVVLPLLDERQRRLVAAALVPALGRGGQARVAEAADMSRNTLITGARSWPAARDPRRGCVGRGRAARRRWSSIREMLVVLDSLVEPDRGGTRCRRCAGRSSRPISWPASWAGWATRPGRASSVGRCTTSVTASRPTPR